MKKLKETYIYNIIRTYLNHAVLSTYSVDFIIPPMSCCADLIPHHKGNHWINSNDWKIEHPRFMATSTNNLGILPTENSLQTTANNQKGIQVHYN